MSKNIPVIGVDVSSETLDLHSTTTHLQVENSTRGFKKALKEFGTDSLYVMENTGVYSIPFATFLYDRGIEVSIVHSTSIKRFAQMKGYRTKTDKADANIIRLYGEEQEVKPWEPKPEWIEAAKSIAHQVDLLVKHKTMIKNRRHALEKSGRSNPKLKAHYKRHIKTLETEIKLLRDEIGKLVKTHEPETLTNLTSIKGVGRDTAMCLIIEANCFKDFDNVKQVASYFGIAPTQHQSGTSVKGSGRISKAGSPKVRKQLYMAAVASLKCNPHCITFKERLKAKNKNGYEIMTAVAHKLLRLAYGVAKSGLPYDPAYRSHKPIGLAVC